MAFAALFQQPNSARDFRSPAPDAFASLFTPNVGPPPLEDALPADDESPEERLLTRSEAEAHRARHLTCRGLPWVSASCALLALIVLSGRMLAPTGSFQAFILEGWAPKLPTCKQFPNLDFLWVAHSNLNHMGPDNGAEGLVYRVRSYKGEHMEMVFNAMHDFKAYDPKMFGLHGFYGSLNVMERSHAHLKVTFKDWETKKPVTVEEFAMTFYDIDEGFAHAGIEEVTIQGDWSVAIVSKQTSINVMHSPDFQKIKFRSTMPSMAMDSPTHPLTLTYQQFQKAVTVRFNDVDSFEISFRVLTAGAHHRFFEFAGEASILCAHLPSGGKAPVGKAYWNPKKRAPPGLVPRKPFETVALTKHKWIFEGWKVTEGAAIRPHDIIFGGKILHGKELQPNRTLKSSANGTVTQLLPRAHAGQTIMPHVGVAIIAFPVVHPPGLEVSEKSKGAYDEIAITDRAYRVAAFHVTAGAHVSAGDTIFSGYPVVGENLGSKIDLKAMESGRAESVLTLIPGHFVLKDVVVLQLRPMVLYPPGLEQKAQDQDHIVKNWKALRFHRWRVHVGSHVKRGQALLTYHRLGDNRHRHVMKSNVAGVVNKLVDVVHGQIVDAHVGLVQIKLIKPQVGHHHEATTTSGAATTSEAVTTSAAATATSGAEITTSGAATTSTTNATTNATGSGIGSVVSPTAPSVTRAPTVPAVRTAPGGSSQRHHGDARANGQQEWDWKWPAVGLAAVGSFGIVGAILFFCWPQAPPAPPEPGPPPKPQVISVTTNQETTVSNGGLATRPTSTHYEHVTHVRHHHHAHH